MATHTPASTVRLPPGAWETVLEFLCARFPAIDRTQWVSRMARGRVLDPGGLPVDPDRAYEPGMRVRYYREVPAETAIPCVESVLYADAHLVVADKPHFLPVMPGGGYVEETLQTRLMRQLDNPDLVPLHRIDRATAGLVLLSPNPETRARYQALFRTREIAKVYECIAPALPEMDFPVVRKTRLAAGEPFFRMQEIVGVANTQTRIEALDRSGQHWRYALHPLTGKKHQLRVHMAALGAAILNDPYYPTLAERRGDDYTRPLKLLARSLAFVDPVCGAPRYFETRLTL